jgi:superfamily II DNA/RNA helicase
MEHHLLHVRDGDKDTTVAEIAARDGRVIMFLDTKHAADRLAKRLLSVGVRASALHGGKSQSQRNRTLAQFKDGQVTALVATNVAARGIHVSGLDLVVNVDPPGDHKDYLHRGGRTARAGESGTVVTLVLPHERRAVDRLMTDAGIAPRTARIRPGEDELQRITGARTPSGIPVVLSPPAEVRPEGSGSTGRRRGRSGGRSTTGRAAGGSGSGSGQATGRGSGQASGRGGSGQTTGRGGSGQATGRGGSGRAAGRGRRSASGTTL